MRQHRNSRANIDLVAGGVSDLAIIHELCCTALKYPLLLVERVLGHPRVYTFPLDDLLSRMHSKYFPIAYLAVERDATQQSA